MSTRKILAKAQRGRRLSHGEALALASCEDLPGMLEVAADLRDRHFGDVVSYSPKVFIPLTQLCRDVCHYCTFAQTPKNLDSPYLTPEQVLDIARQGQAAGCVEVLFTLGDKPELRYSAARDALAEMGYDSTIAYLKAMAELVWRETGLLPHLNPGLLNAEELAELRPVAVSMGIMLESSSLGLTRKGMPHCGSPDKQPALRLRSIAEAGKQNIPMTSGILIGIRETRKERVESLLALRDLHEAYGNIQEVIVQNFRARPSTKMCDAVEPDVQELQWTIAIARLVLGEHMSIQAPPNLSIDNMTALLAAGINDWGGVSPEAPWPGVEKLAAVTAAGGKILAPRLPLYPAYIDDHDRWLDPRLLKAVLDHSDSFGLARTPRQRNTLYEAIESEQDLLPTLTVSG